ncbi:MAG: twin-arginine translocation pathway signal protein, partial [Pseudomonadota bacterium]
MLSRRSLVAGLGGLAVVGVAGGTLFATTRTPHAALAPWTSPGSLAQDPRIKAVEWAILAPNPHNRQPWLMALVGESEALLTADPDRRLPQTDPFDRQILIGLGAFSELLVLAAAQYGHSVTVTPFPDGAAASTEPLDGRPIAHFAFAPGGAPDPLFQAAPIRRSYKEPFEQERPLRAETLTAIGAKAGRPMEGTVSAEAVASLKALCLKSWTIE